MKIIPISTNIIKQALILITDISFKNFKYPTMKLLIAYTTKSKTKKRTLNLDTLPEYNNSINLRCYERNIPHSFSYIILIRRYQQLSFHVNSNISVMPDLKFFNRLIELFKLKIELCPFSSISDIVHFRIYLKIHINSF